MEDHASKDSNQSQTSPSESSKIVELVTRDAEFWDSLEDIDKKSFVDMCRSWLPENKTDAAAGLVLAKLLKMKPGSEFKSDARKWVDLFPDHDFTNDVIAALIGAAPSADVFVLAKEKLEAQNDTIILVPIIKALLSADAGGLTDGLIVAQLERDPTAFAWTFVFSVKKSDVTQPLLTLQKRWLELNVDNSALIIRNSSTSPEISSAIFKWIKRGGSNSEYMARVLERLIRDYAHDRPSEYPSILNLARKWLAQNPNHEQAGKMFAAILSATGSKADLRSAKIWYFDHHDADRSWFIISDALECAYRARLKPDPDMVLEAQMLVRNWQVGQVPPRLVGALLAVSATPESIAVAKQIAAQHNLLWIIIRLLNHSPDVEAVMSAEATYPRWKDHEELEPEMLYAILKAEPKNALALRRLKVWKNRDPGNSYIQACLSSL